MILDVDVSDREVAGLSSPNALAALLAKLRFDVSQRRMLAPTAYQFPDKVLPQIRSVELLASHDDVVSKVSALLFVLKSVTALATRQIVAGLRDRGENHLVILADADFSRIDFVLVDEVPTETNSPIARAPSTKLVLRSHTIDRQANNRVDQRFLKRLTWTEAEVATQWSKIRAAFDVAAWSSEHFNNRALFSDHYLSERLKEFAAWEAPVTSADIDRIRNLYGSWQHAERSRDELAPLLKALGFEPTGLPDGAHFLARHDGKPVAFALTFSKERMLDDINPHDADAALRDVNPGAKVVKLLEDGVAPWGIITNGRIWRLYSAKAHSRATNYYEIDLHEALGLTETPGDVASSFRYFRNFFSRSAFEPQAENKPSFADAVLEGSAAFAKKLGETLKDQVFREVFPILAEGFIHAAKKAGDPQPDLAVLFRSVLTLLYRLLFLLYAESRDLLPLREVQAYGAKSLTRLKTEIAKRAGDTEAHMLEKLEAAFAKNSFDLYDRLLELFAIIDKGSSAAGVPVYNGGLFVTSPTDDLETDDIEAVRYLAAHKVPDYFLAVALDRLARGIDDKSQGLAFIDYKSLGVRQLGSIYEGLLEFRLAIATEKLGVKRLKSAEVYTPWKDLTEREQARCERSRNVVGRGKVYLVNDKSERKASGSYYTPDHIVKYIVEHTVGPVLDAKLEALRKTFRSAEQWHRDNLRTAPQKREPIEKYTRGKAVINEWEEKLLKPFFDFKVLDPAMGSGHFLVEAVDFITDRLIRFLDGFPWNPVRVLLDNTRDDILADVGRQDVTVRADRLTYVNLLKRHVLKRCIFGVDLNPMAVELAKVSLWLDCFTIGAPLSFLDHHLRCGNSLIGVKVEEAREALENTKDQRELLFSRFNGLLTAAELMRHVGELPDATSEQVKTSAREFHKAHDGLEPFRRILDLYTAQWFLPADGYLAPGVKAKGRKRGAAHPALVFLRDSKSVPVLKAEKVESGLTKLDFESDKKLVRDALAVAREKRFFHWQLEFPEVFLKERPGTERVAELAEGAGFDAIIGNPPYRMLQPHNTSQSDLEYVKARFERAAYKVEMFHLFTEKSILLLCANGWQGSIIPATLLNNVYAEGLRAWIAQSKALKFIAVPQEKIFADADVHAMVLIVGPHLPVNASHNETLAVTHTLSSLPFGVKRRYHHVDASRFSALPRSSWNITLTESVAGIIDQMNAKSVPLRDVGILNRGLVTGDKKSWTAARRLSKEYIPLLNGSDVLQYRTLAPSIYVRFVRPKNAGGTWDAALHLAPHKVVIRQIGSEPVAALASDSIAISANIFAVRTGDLKKDRALVGLLNTDAARFFWLTMFRDFKSSFPQITLASLEEFPVPKSILESESVLNEMNEITTRLSALLSANNNSSANTNQEELTLTDELNQIVNRGYGLANEEIALLAAQDVL